MRQYFLLFSFPEFLIRRFVPKSSLGSFEQFREVSFQPSNNFQTNVSDCVQKGRHGELSVHHHVIGKARTDVLHRTLQQSPSSCIFAIARPAGFQIERKHQRCPHHANHD